MENKDPGFFRPLESIQSVEAPEFLFTRIQQRIEVLKADLVSPKKVWTAVAAFAVLIVINLYAIRHSNISSHERNIAQVFQLMPSNNLYE